MPSTFEIVDGTADLIKTVAGLLSGFATVGVDESRISVENHRKLTEAISEGVTLTAAQGLVEGLRRVKDEAEIETIAAGAAALTDGVYAWLEERGFEGRASATWRWPPRRGCASSAPRIPRSRRSSQPAPTAP